MGMSGDGATSAVAAIDIGSNSLKLAVARLNSEGAVEEFDWELDTVRLGRGLGETGTLADDRIEAALVALTRMEARARSEGATRVLAVATEAVRRAANGEQFMERLRAETGIEAEIISGDREAELSFRGMAALADLSGPVLIGDIGGASTEVIVARDGQMQRAQSCPVGSGRLADRHLREDPPAAAELAACRSDARATLAATGMWPLAEPSGVRFLLAGGTGELLGKLVGRDLWSAGDAGRVLEELTSIHSSELAGRLGIQELRARVLPAGIAAALALADLTDPVSIEAARSGIRTGLFLEVFGATQASGRVKRSLTGKAPE
jgi:exopolyphosphatase / guanosine-5'-triphosphate,3'-diphosphate pyrophosphatase